MQNAELEKKRYDLEQAKENLEDLRDSQIEALDAEIDRLDKIKSKYEEICEVIEQAIREQKATDMFGSGWQDKVLSGNDNDIYTYIKDLHTKTEFENDSITKQIESNERIIAQTQLIIDRFNAQEITLGQANAAINQIISLMSNGYSADEQLSTQLALDQVNSIKEFSQITDAKITENMNLLNDYFVVANENNLKIIEIMGTQTEKLEEIRRLDEENQRLYEEMLKKIEQMNKGYNSHGSSSGGDDDGGWDGGEGVKSAGTITSGMNGGTYSDDRHDKSNSGSGSPSHDDDQDEEHGPGVHHKGVLAGYPDSSRNNELGALTKLSTEDLKPHETFIKVLDNELVFNKDQQRQLLANYASALNPFSSIGQATHNLAPIGSKQSNNVVVNMGDIILPDVSDPDSFAKAMNDHIALAFQKNFSKHF